MNQPRVTLLWDVFLIDLQECANPCCNATTCRLTEGSQCAGGDCCDRCKVRPPTPD